jgi:hypothetical protein
MIDVELAADTAQMAMGDELVAAKYAWRGYRVDNQEAPTGRSHWRGDGYYTLLGFRDDVPVGTITVGVDSSAGLLLDEGNGEVLDLFRRAGRRIAEFVRLAVQDEANSALYHLFRRAYEVARTLYQTTDILMEVNPRHMAFYEKVFGFAVAGDERVCPRVNAPAVLMRLDLVKLDRERGIPAPARRPVATECTPALAYAAA